MKDMEFTIKGPIKHIPSWETTQQYLRDVFNNYNLVITRIHRRDGGCDYRQPGIYDLTLRDRRTNDEIGVVFSMIDQVY